MTILYVCSNMSVLAGGQIVMADKINWLAEHGYKIVLFMCDQGEKLVIDFHPSVILERPEIFFYRIYSQPLWKRPFDYYKRHRLFRKKLHECLEKYHPDVVVTPTLSQVKEICNVCGTIPVVAEMHNNEGSHFRKSSNETWLGDLLREHYRKNVGGLSKMIVLTHKDKKDWLRYMQEEKIQVIHNMVRPNTTGKISTTESKDVIFIGRVTFQKGIDYLIKIWEIVYKAHPDWTLHLYGKPYGGGDEQFQQQLDLCKGNLNIVQHEPTPQIMERMVDSSIFIQPSRYEAYTLVLHEAMSCGLPIVLFDYPYCAREIVQEGETGFLVPLGDCEAFAEKIIYLIEHPEERKRMGQNGVETAKHFLADDMMPEWEKLFSNLKRSQLDD